MKILSTTLTFLVFCTLLHGQKLYKTSDTYIRFFSEAPLENIEATNTESQGLMNLETKQVAMVVPIIEFHFEKALMEEHFNENYMETSKYKTGKFSGKINEEVDFSQDFDSLQVTATGTLTIHGVPQNRTLSGTLTKKGDKITLHSIFMVPLEDHDIEVPKMVVENIAEVIEVTCNFVFEPK